MISSMFVNGVILLVLCQVSLQQGPADATLAEKISKSPCRPSEKQKVAYKECAKAIYGKEDLTLAELEKEETGKRLGPCVWSKLGLFGKNGFDQKAFEEMISEMPVDEKIKQGIRGAAEACLKETGVSKGLKCVGNEIKKICTTTLV